MNTYNSRGSADPNGDVFRQLERFLSAHNPRLKHISVTGIRGTDDWDTRVPPFERWYEVTFTADDGSGLSWFYSLPPGDQAELLGNPHRDVNGPLAVKLASRPGLYTPHFTPPESDGLVWRISPDAARRLSAIRRQLDAWWVNVTTEQKAYITENRSGQLAQAYAEIVHGAGRDPLADGPDAYLVVLVSDTRTGQFRLPAMVRAYVDMTVAAAP